METTAEGSSWQSGYKQPFMLKLAGAIPLLGVGNATYGAAGILRTIDGKLRSEGDGGKWVAAYDVNVIKTGNVRIGQLWFNNIHALALVTEWERHLRAGPDVLADEARLRRLPADVAEHYWGETFGRDATTKPMGSGANQEDPIVLWPMNNVAAAVIENGILESIFGTENVDWIAEERRYPGGSILEYHVRRKNGEKRIVYFDLSRLNESVDNKQNRKTNSIVEKATGIPSPSKALRDINSRFSTFYLLDSQTEHWKRFVAPGDVRTQSPSPAMKPAEDARPDVRESLMTRVQWQRRVREAELAVEALERQHGHPLPVWRENLRLMKANPPKEFAPERRLWVRAYTSVFPPSQTDLDQVILNDWKAGKPPQLPPSRASVNRPDNLAAIPPVIGADKLLPSLRAKAEAGDPQSQYELGAAFDFGNLGTAQDEVKAVKWYRKAAEQNHAEAQFNLGACLLNGRGVAKDEAEAVKWFRKAAEQNIPQSLSNLGLCYENGLGVAKDEAEAVKWYRRAAEQNYATAQYNLGICYVAGKGVAKDELEAYKWFLVAAAQGHENAKTNAGVAEGRLTQEQIAEAQKRARYFKPR